MYQQLQRNFDVIQYLVRNASTEQLTWRQHASSRSLQDVLCQLRDVERWNACVQLPNDDSQPEISPKDIDDGRRHPFEAYASYRRQTMALLQSVTAHRKYDTARHRLFGRVPVHDLVDIIDEYDRIHIHQIENVIHNMPRNPLYARACDEIRLYHRRYQPHLAKVRSLLDIGVGSGLALQYVRRHNPHLAASGLDIQDLRLPKVEVPLKIYDGHTMPFDSNHFDVSLLFYVLHHCRDAQRLLAEAARVTRKRIIIIEEFHQPGIDATSLDMTERQSHRALGIPPNLFYQLFDKPEFEAMLAAHKLTVLEQQRLPSKTTRPVRKVLYVVQVE